ncbi:MAG TPA: hypothetical protein VFB38_17000 [Chthonomonadaceae bacterium]|nr:hypothetical protein [Chthonomonadaceae bacterium]
MIRARKCQEPIARERRSRGYGWLLLGGLGAGMLGTAIWTLMRARAQAQAGAEIGGRRDTQDKSAPLAETAPATRAPEAAAGPLTPTTAAHPAETPKPVSPPPEAASVSLAAGSTTLGPAAGELSDHDFLTPPVSHRASEEKVTVNANQADPETLFGGGTPGEVAGDQQPVGDVPSIMDQEEATPDFAQERG